MYIKYRVIEVFPQDHLMVVRYFTELFPEDYFANFFNPDGSIARTPAGYPVRCRTDYSISFYDNKCPDEQYVKTLINRAAPRKFFETLEDDFHGRLNHSCAVELIGKVGEVENIQIPNS